MDCHSAGVKRPHPLLHMMQAGMHASPSASAARVPMSEEELDVHREMELDRQLTGTTRR